MSDTPVMSKVEAIAELAKLGLHAFFSAKLDMTEVLREMRRLCDKAIREGGAE